MLASFSEDVRWPFQRISLCNAVAACTCITVLTIAALEIYDALSVENCTDTGIENCTTSTWSEEIWGPVIPGDAYCEKIRQDHFMAEHLNSLSNTAYMFVGLLILLFPLGDYFALRSADETRREAWRFSNQVVSWPFYSVLYAVSILLLSVGSFAFHAHRTLVTRHFDVGALYAAVVPLTCYGFLVFVRIDLDDKSLLRRRLLTLAGVLLLDVALIIPANIVPTTPFLATLVLTPVACVFVLYKIRKGDGPWTVRKREQLFGGQTNWRIMRIKCLAWAMITLLTGFAARSIGVYLFGIGQASCDPESYFQLHALWHVLSSLPLLCGYFLIRSEFVDIDASTRSEFNSKKIDL